MESNCGMSYIKRASNKQTVCKRDTQRVTFEALIFPKRKKPKLSSLRELQIDKEKIQRQL